MINLLKVFSFMTTHTLYAGTQTINRFSAHVGDRHKGQSKADSIVQRIEQFELPISFDDKDSLFPSVAIKIITATSTIRRANLTAGCALKAANVIATLKN